MMKPLMRYALFLSVFVVLLLGAGASAARAADPGDDATVRENLPLFFDDRVLRGENAREDAYFQIAAGRQLTEGSYIELNFEHSPTVLHDGSSLTVLMDDVPLDSIPLNADSVKGQSWRIDVSKLNLQPGFHKVSLWAYMPMQTYACANPLNSSQWLTIKKDSGLRLQLAKLPLERTDLSLYPLPFFEKGAQRPLPSVIVVPDGIDPAEFASTARLVQFFAKEAGSIRPDFPVYPESEVTDALLSERHSIWIGLAGRWKDKGAQLLGALEKPAAADSESQGYIAAGESPWNAAYRALAVSGNPSELARAVSILTDAALYSQLNGNAFSIPAELRTVRTSGGIVFGEPQTMTFEMLGHNDMVMEHIQESRSGISFPLPVNGELAEAAKLRLLFRHSQSIEFGQSSLTVKINGIPAASQRLSRLSSTAGVLEADVPSSWIGQRRSLDIEIIFQMNHRGNEDEEEGIDSCLGNNLLGHWAVVDKASSLTVTLTDRRDYTLQLLPGPFLNGDRWNRTAVVLPERTGHTELSTAMALIGHMAGNATDNAELSAVSATDPELADKIKDRHIVYIGTAQQLPAFMRDFPDAPLRFEENRAVSRTDYAEVLPILQSGTAVMQISPSPLNRDKSLLVLAATSDSSRGSLLGVLSDPEESGRLAGKFSVVDPLGKVHAFPEPTEPSSAAADDGGAGFYQVRLNAAVFWTVFLFLVLLIAVGLRLSRSGA